TVFFPGDRSAFVLTNYEKSGIAGDIEERRSVEVQTPTLVDQGSVSSVGQLSRSLHFGSTRSDRFSEPPTYPSKTERWNDPFSGEDRSASTQFGLIRRDANNN